MAVGLAGGAVHVRDELLELAVLMGLADPLARGVHQVLEAVLGAEGLGLEAGHLAGGSRPDALGPATHHRPQGGIEAEALGVVHIFIACQAAVDRRPQQRRQGVLGVLPGPGILQAARCCPGQPGGIIEFPLGEESGVTGDGGAVELQLDQAVEIDSQGVLSAVTHWVPRPFQQGVVGNAGVSGEKAQTPCRNDRAI
jgi:hypothetical protein